MWTARQLLELGQNLCPLSIIYIMFLKYKYKIQNNITLLPYHYHYVESMNDTSFTILLNLDNNDSNENTCKCDEAFEKHWPDAKWYSS